jgi:hypothetical protein
MRDETVPGSLLVSFAMALLPFAHVRVFPNADVFWRCQRGEGEGGRGRGEWVWWNCVRREEGETEVGEIEMREV